MARPIAVGIDVGTYQVRVLVAERNEPNHPPKVIGIGFAESRGLHHGYIINPTDAAKSIKTALAQAERSSGISIKKALLAVSGVGLNGLTASGTAVVSRADLEITDLDIKKAVDASQAEIPETALVNRKILHVIPVQFKIDGKVVLGRPTSWKGGKLEVKTLFITCLEQHIEELIEVIESLGVEIEDVTAAPLAASLVSLTKPQKIAGVVLANIGAETVSIVVFENNDPVSLEVFPLGSTDITNDIALGLRIPLEEAENIKLGNAPAGNYSKKKLEEIVEARLSDIFELVGAHLKKIGRDSLLPAGIVLTGGGASLVGIDQFARLTLELPSRLSSGLIGGNSKIQVKDATWSVAYGLCLIGLSDKDETLFGSNFAKKARGSFVSFFKQFLP